VRRASTFAQPEVWQRGLLSAPVSGRIAGIAEHASAQERDSNRPAPTSGRATVEPLSMWLRASQEYSPVARLTRARKGVLCNRQERIALTR
jgi:hypothetical protein